METHGLAETRLRKDAELNRQRILAAAREVFRDRGLNATLNDVARHAGVGVGTVYRRFADLVAGRGPQRQAQCGSGSPRWSGSSSRGPRHRGTSGRHPAAGHAAHPADARRRHRTTSPRRGYGAATSP